MKNRAAKANAAKKKASRTKRGTVTEADLKAGREFVEMYVRKTEFERQLKGTVRVG